MSSLFPVLTESGRRWWIGAAVFLGVLGAAVAVMRRDWTALVVIVVALAALVAVWLWTRDAAKDIDEDRWPGEE